MKEKKAIKILNKMKDDLWEMRSRSLITLEERETIVLKLNDIEYRLLNLSKRSKNV